ncbi:amidohydrolase family protein [Mesorhizobium sp.]|uniref:amidohydrolase family protein n=1 Tax=Mesorhizobium sp. TaxID=1871066 RepID=UPI0034510678
MKPRSGVDHALETFGPDLTMVGTNIPVDLLFGSPAKIIATIHAVTSVLSPYERIAMMRSNAESFYRV